MQSNNEIQNRCLTEKDILNRYQISHTTLWRWVREGRFPQGEFLGPQTKRWPLKKLLRWEKEMMQQHTEEP